MQLTDAPGKLVLPFADAGAKNAIPVASQIGITPGAASLTDGFPPLTRTPLAAGGVPPSGLDMNGVLYELSAVVRWANAGGGYPYDGTFSTDGDVNGYPQGARVLRADGLGYWFNTVDDNDTDPDAGGAGWVPDFAPSSTAVTMTSSNVTLTAVQYGQPVIVITGTLTTNLNLIFPAIAAHWFVINNTTGAYDITAKTASGTGEILDQTTTVVGDGTNIYKVQEEASSSVLVGQCQLAKSGANIVLSPFNGNKLAINGALETVPSAGVSLAPSGLTPSTLYYIYAYMNSGTMTLEASTTGHSTDATTGVEIKTGDATRTMVGWARPITGPAFAATDTQQFVLSWFNTAPRRLKGAFTATRSTSSSTPVELNSEIRVEFLIKASEAADLRFMGTVVSSLSGANSYAAVGYDGTTAETVETTGSSLYAPLNVGTKRLGLSEGYHYATALGWATSTTANFGNSVNHNTLEGAIG